MKQIYYIYKKMGKEGRGIAELRGFGLGII